MMIIMKQREISVLYLDDELDNLASFKANFRREFKVFTASNVEAAMEILKNNDIQVAVSDHNMPGTSGMDFFQTLTLTSPDIIRILITGYSNIEIVIDAINRGQVYRYFSKPMNPAEIKSTIYAAASETVTGSSLETKYKQLLEANEQLEFMLRQKMIS
jgi:response regulator RpfG family c-di-GMP phosphodiesterase